MSWLIVRRGDIIHMPTASFRVTRYDEEREVIVGTDGARTYQISDLMVRYGDAILEPQERK